MVTFCCCCNYATIDHSGMQFFTFAVLSVIIGPHNVLTPRIGKTHLPIVSANVRDFRLI